MFVKQVWMIGLISSGFVFGTSTYADQNNFEYCLDGKILHCTNVTEDARHCDFVGTCASNDVLTATSGGVSTFTAVKQCPPGQIMQCKGCGDSQTCFCKVIF